MAAEQGGSKRKKKSTEEQLKELATSMMTFKKKFDSLNNHLKEKIGSEFKRSITGLSEKIPQLKEAVFEITDLLKKFANALKASMPSSGTTESSTGIGTGKGGRRSKNLLPAIIPGSSPYTNPNFTMGENINKNQIIPKITPNQLLAELYKLMHSRMLGDGGPGNNGPIPNPKQRIRVVPTPPNPALPSPINPSSPQLPPPGKKKKDDEPPPPESLFDKLNTLKAFSNAAGKLNEYAERWDAVQRRALASNTQVENLKISTKLGADMVQLGDEMVALREQGVRNLDDSTLKLIARMKMTDQSTVGLRNFLGENSLNLLLNTKQAQELAVTVSKSSQEYGARQDAALEFLNKVSQRFSVATLAGASPELAAALTTLKSSIQGRADKEIDQLAQLITNPDLGPAMRSGLEPLISQLLASQGNVDAQVDLLRQIAKTGANTVKELTGNGRLVQEYGLQGIAMTQNVLNTIGPGLQSLPQLSKALEDSAESSKQLIEFTRSLKELKDLFDKPIQLFTKKLEEFVFVLGEYEWVKKILPYVGAFVAGFAVLGTIAAAVAALIAFFNPIVFGAALVGGLGGLGLYAWLDNLEEINENTKKQPEFKFEAGDFESGLLNFIKSTTESILQVNKQDDRLIEVTSKLLEEQKDVNRSLKFGTGLPMKAAGVTR